MAWLKAAGIKKVGNKVAAAAPAPAPAPASAKAAKNASSSASGSFNAKLTTLLAMSEEIASAEAALAQLKGKFSSLKASL